MSQALYGSVILLGVVLLAYSVFLRLKGHTRVPLTIAEYWVYLPKDKLPVQNEVMELILHSPAIGPKEGLLFSDIRLHVALVLRSKNAYLFRPDLFENHIEPTPEILHALSESVSLVKVRYASETTPKDDRYLQLLPYLAYAYAKLGDGYVIYDVQQERLMTRDDLQALLKEDPEATRADVHLQVVWQTTEIGGRAVTRGLAKRGLPELTTDDMDPDERVLVTAVVDEASRLLWNGASPAGPLEVEAFDDKFRLEIDRPKRGVAQVRVLRVHAL